MKKSRICITDDDRDDYELIVSVFAELGFEHEFTYAENGGRLLDLLEDAAAKGQLPDLVILDLNMPKVNGLMALDWIRANHSLARVPVLIYTTTNCSDEKNKCYAHGADGFFTKQISLKHIARFVTGIHSFLTNADQLPGGKPKAGAATSKNSTNSL